MKKNVAIVLFSLVASLIYAIPGVEHFINDQSGEFVYYRDYSFSRESYIGFLTYDQGTFAARYFAPATDELPYKNIELLFTIDSTKNYIDMTGERFITPVVQEDTEVINYIHDLIYEFSARRKKVGEISPSVASGKTQNESVKYISSTNFIDNGFVSKEKFEQFGGEVFVYYDYLIPIFNIKKIKSNSQENLLVAIATGKLKNSEDKSFSEFQMISEENESKKFKVKKNKTKTVQIEKTNLVFDDGWTNAGNLENMFFYGNIAMLRIGIIDCEDYYNYLKMACSSTNDMFVPLDKISILNEDCKITIHSKKYTSEKSFHLINSIVTKNLLLEKTENALLSLTVSNAEYELARKYFSDIVKSWK